MSYQSDYEKRRGEIIRGAPTSWPPQNQGQSDAEALWAPRRNDLRTPQPQQQSDYNPIPIPPEARQPFNWRSFFYYLIGMAVFSILILATFGLLAWLLRRYVEAL